MTLKLTPLQHFKKRSGPVLLIIMDGIGIGKDADNNAVYKANTPYLDKLPKTATIYTQLKAHGTAVGMPSDEDMGNSEVGHNALGAGRVFDQGATLVQKAIDSKQLFSGETWKTLIQKSQNHTLHFIGLLSDGNVHSHINHLLAMTETAAQQGVKRIRIHTLLDGRDVDEKSALLYIDRLETHLQNLEHTHNGNYKIASGGGRMITTMDRYNADWDIVKRGWDTHVLGEARHFKSAKEAIEIYYQEDPNRNDQYLPPFVIADNQTPIGTIQDNDCVVFFNFRGDRAIELSMAFEAEAPFPQFDRKRVPKVFFAGMMQYDGDLQLPKNYLVGPPEIDHPISDYLCSNGIRSFAISETQKYGHVTYFWNGNNSGYVDKTLETYVEIPSDKLPFDQKPEMKANEITAKSIELLQSGHYDFGRINFPNGDMVGHTGNFQATVTSCEVTDHCVKTLVDTVNQLGGITIILADHGNADEMWTIKNGVKIPKTSHTLNPVPFAIVDSGFEGEYHLKNTIATPGLANVAATICNLLGFEKPKDYEESLIEF